jgi:hypothetical protein
MACREQPLSAYEGMMYRSRGKICCAFFYIRTPIAQRFLFLADQGTHIALAPKTVPVNRAKLFLSHMAIAPITDLTATLQRSSQQPDPG